VTHIHSDESGSDDRHQGHGSAQRTDGAPVGPAPAGRGSPVRSRLWLLVAGVAAVGILAAGAAHLVDSITSGGEITFVDGAQQLLDGGE
jgi:hypothetical protein